MKFIILLFFLGKIAHASCPEAPDLNIIYINGINNTIEETQDSLYKLEKTIRSNQDYSKANICFDYIYNPTQSFLDLFEVLDQKLHENFPLQILALYSPHLSKFLRKLQEPLTGHSSKAFLRNTVYPKIENLYGKAPIIIVSHSQGNLIANEIGIYLSNQNKKLFANLQVASTTYNISTPISDYITSTQDRVIDLLGPSVPPDNIQTLNAYDYDRLGHNFINVYLNPNIKTNKGITIDHLLIKKINKLKLALTKFNN